jgi:N-acetylglucosamine malate deacetylase 1
MKILAVGAHPDDIEIFMYGLIAACLKRGDNISLVVATDGADGKVLTSNNLKNKRELETISGLSKLVKPNFMGLPDGRLSNTSEAYELIEKYVNGIQPDFIITHDEKDYHPDHRALSRIISDVASFKCPVFYAETLMGLNFDPDYYIDITEYFTEKVEAILAHKTQSPEKFVNVVKLMNSYRAAQCNAPQGSFSECYRVSKTFPFGDVRSLLPSSQKFRPYYVNNKDSLI